MLLLTAVIAIALRSSDCRLLPCQDLCRYSIVVLVAHKRKFLPGLKKVVHDEFLQLLLTVSKNYEAKLAAANKNKTWSSVMKSFNNHYKTLLSNSYTIELPRQRSEVDRSVNGKLLSIVRRVLNNMGIRHRQLILQTVTGLQDLKVFTIRRILKGKCYQKKFISLGALRSLLTCHCCTRSILAGGHLPLAVTGYLTWPDL